MSKEEIKGVWAAVFEADSRVEEAESVLEAAVRKRSDALKEIAEKCGKGPFQVKGKIMTIRSRSRKDGSEPVYFLVGPRTAGLTVVDD